MNFLELIRILIVELVFEMVWNNELEKLLFWMVNFFFVFVLSVLVYLGILLMLIIVKYWLLVLVFNVIFFFVCFIWKVFMLFILLNILLRMVLVMGLDVLRCLKCFLKILLLFVFFSFVLLLSILLIFICREIGDVSVYLKNLMIWEILDIFFLFFLVKLFEFELIIWLLINIYKGFLMLYWCSFFLYFLNSLSCL